MQLTEHNRLWVNQRFEAAELFGFETRNKYQILDEQKHPVAYAAEQRKGAFGFLLRQFLGHWFRFDIHFFNASREVFLIASHPFRWYFTRIELTAPNGRYLGAIQKRFAIFTKRFDVENANGETLFKVASPIWRLWTFIFEHQGREVAAVRKKWAGALSEIFTDKDSFLVEFTDSEMSDDERTLVMASAIFIDLLYFEQNQTAPSVMDLT